MSDKSVIKTIISLAGDGYIRHGWMAQSQTWHGLGHSRMSWARLSRDNWRSMLESISFSFHISVHFEKFFFCFPCFCRIWREIPGANGFGGASEARSSFRELWELCSITGLVFRIWSPVAFKKIIILCFRSRATVTWLTDKVISKLSRECVLWRGYVEIWNRNLISGHRRN